MKSAAPGERVGRGTGSVGLDGEGASGGARERLRLRDRDIGRRGGGLSGAGDAVTIEQRDVGRAMRSLHFCAARQRLRGRARNEQSRCRKGPLPKIHGATSIAAFGASPKLSGAYIASTRVGGRAKRPGLFSRTLYSKTCLPFGRYSK